MPTLPTYPGVYVEELESGVRPINAVATRSRRSWAIRLAGSTSGRNGCFSFADYERAFGGLAMTAS